MNVRDIRRLISTTTDELKDIDYINYKGDKATSSKSVVTKRLVLKRRLTSFRFSRIRGLYVIGRISLIRRSGRYKGTSLAYRGGILTNLKRKTIDYKGCRSDTIRLDDANGRILGRIDITQTIGIYVIAYIETMLGI